MAETSGFLLSFETAFEFKQSLRDSIQKGGSYGIDEVDACRARALLMRG
jgi:hypothetical protein